MRTFQDLYAIAADRKGGEQELESLIPPSATRADLLAIPEDRWLMQFARAVFLAGFSWKVIEAKWPNFETAFHGFDPDACAFLEGDAFDALITNPGIVRNGAKISAVRDNAIFLRDLRAEGGIAQVVADWPATDYNGLLDILSKRGSRLGGTSSQYALRFLGVDGYIFSADVVARLVAEGVIDKPPTSKTAKRAVQAAFNTWMQQSDRSLTAISRVLAMSV